jgi:hypothetical protein
MESGGTAKNACCERSWKRISCAILSLLILVTIVLFIKTFLTTNYPNLKKDNVGKKIPRTSTAAAVFFSLSVTIKTRVTSKSRAEESLRCPKRKGFTPLTWRQS